MILASRGFTTVSAHINILHHNNNSQMDTYGAMFPINFQATHHGKHWETMDVVSHHFKGLGFGVLGFWFVLGSCRLLCFGGSWDCGLLLRVLGGLGFSGPA